MAYAGYHQPHQVHDEKNCAEDAEEIVAQSVTVGVALVLSCLVELCPPQVPCYLSRQSRKVKAYWKRERIVKF